MWRDELRWTIWPKVLLKKRIFAATLLKELPGGSLLSNGHVTFFMIPVIGLTLVAKTAYHNILPDEGAFESACNDH